MEYIICKLIISMFDKANNGYLYVCPRFLSDSEGRVKPFFMQYKWPWLCSSRVDEKNDKKGDPLALVIPRTRLATPSIIHPSHEFFVRRSKRYLPLLLATLPLGVTDKNYTRLASIVTRKKLWTFLISTACMRIYVTIISLYIDEKIIYCNIQNLIE